MHAGGVRPALVGDVQGDGLHLALEGRGGDAQRCHLLVGGAVGRHFRTQHVPRAHKAFRQKPVAAHLLRPCRVFEDARIGRQADVGVDQRGAAKAARHQHVDVLADADVEQRRRRPEPAVRAVHLRLGSGAGDAVGEVAGQELAPALQHRHLLPAARQARSGNAAPIARSHHDHVVVRLQLRSGHRQPRLHTPYFPVFEARC